MMQPPLEKTPKNLAVAGENLRKIRAFAQFYVAFAEAVTASLYCASYWPSTGQMRYIWEPPRLTTTQRYKSNL